MTTRSIATASLWALALCCLFLAALPAQAQCFWVYNSKVDNFAFHGIDLIGDWNFSWDTITSESTVYFEVKGGDISQVWLSVSNFDIDRENGKTYLSADSLSNNPTGNIYDFRVAVEGKNAQGNCIIIGWAKITVIFQG